MNRIFGICAAAALLATATTASAQETKQGHESVYGRLDVGANYMSLSNSDSDTSVSGIGTAFTLTAGYAIIPNLVLHGEVGYQMALSPGMSRGGESVDSKFTKGLSMSFLTVGPGATYFLDNGISFGGSVLFASADVSTDASSDDDAATGIGLRLGAGKDFWMTEQFALNVGADFLFAAVSAGEGKATTDSNAMSFGLRVGGSFN